MEHNKQTIGELAADAVSEAGRTARHLAFLSGQRVRILQERDRIRRLYTRLGKVYYKDYITDEEPDEAEYLPLCSSISAAYRRINDLKASIEEAKASYVAGKSGVVALSCDEDDLLPCEDAEEAAEPEAAE